MPSSPLMSSGSSGFVLTINGGSSSIKFAAFYRGDDNLQRRLSGQVERVGTPQASLQIKGESSSRAIVGGNVDAAIAAIGEAVQRASGGTSPGAVVHRIVHGGTNLFEPCRIDDSVMAELRKLAAIDPDHLPAEIALAEAIGKRYPDVPQVACFDTAFHRHLPDVSRVLPIPRKWTEQGVRRFGFHGLSYEYLLGELGRVGSDGAKNGRVILAHLGNGASMAAVREGRAVDTTMSFTPTAGLVMGTRCGDLDPGVLIYLMRSKGITVDQIDDLVNRESGLKGVSGGSSDMRDLLGRRESDAAAKLAIDIFCYTARKFIGALAAGMGGVDTLVFSAGIGEHLPVIRAQIGEGLEFLGIELDLQANQNNSPVISRAGGRVTVRVIATDEEIVLARAGFALLGG